MKVLTWLLIVGLAIEIFGAVYGVREIFRTGE